MDKKDPPHQKEKIKQDVIGNNNEQKGVIERRKGLVSKEGLRSKLVSCRVRLRVMRMK